MESLWASLNSDWRERAACGEVDPDTFTPTVETPNGLAQVNARFCNACPVRSNCLNSALINNDFGYWGGTDTAQRRALRRVRNRAKCPLCTGGNLVVTSTHEVCVSCGASWKSGLRPVPRHVQAGLPGLTVEDIAFAEEIAQCL
jgi:Transcription factor WhiB